MQICYKPKDYWKNWRKTENGARIGLGSDWTDDGFVWVNDRDNILWKTKDARLERNVWT